jgi:hypothetical protein
MKKPTRIIQFISCGIIFLFIFSSFISVYGEQFNVTKKNGKKTYEKSHLLPIKPVINYNESFFTFAIFWGTYEERWGRPFFWVRVFNRDPWENRTINVIGYQNWEHKWTYKKAFMVDCQISIGFAILGHVCGMGYNVDAF